jgi:hypothetical protein
VRYDRGKKGHWTVDFVSDEIQSLSEMPLNQIIVDFERLIDENDQMKIDEVTISESQN